MEKLDKHEHRKDQFTDIKTFPVLFPLTENQGSLTIHTNTPSKISKEEIINQALKFHSQGNINEAAKYYQAFIDQGFIDHRVYSNYGAVLKELGKQKEAELFYRKAIEIKPDFANAYTNLADLLRDLGDLKEAKLSAQKAIDIEPNCAPAYYILGLIFLEKGEYELCQKYCSESACLLRGKDSKEFDDIRFKIISKAKILHDIEQFEYLASIDIDKIKFTNLAKIYKEVASEIKWPSETQLIYLNNKYQSVLKNTYNRLINKIDTPRLNQKVINNSLNAEEVTKDYFDHDFGLTYIDNFLSPSALVALRKFLLGSSIWFDIKPNGYIGSYLKEGLACPLIFQIGDELRKKFPKIFKDYSINQIWAFKYASRTKNNNSSLKGINVHADFAAVNVNFWITSNEANLNPNSGGLIVYDVEAPKNWDFNTYNNNEQKIRGELKKSKGNTKVIPHQENRAVIFNSNLFHETDNYEFKDGYENRRINVTMLFGKRCDG